MQHGASSQESKWCDTASEAQLQVKGAAVSTRGSGTWNTKKGAIICSFSSSRNGGTGTFTVFVPHFSSAASASASLAKPLDSR